MITILAELMIMAAYFLVLYAGVAWIQDKRFFASAPKENLAAIPDRKERFRGAHAIGWLIAGIAVLLFLGAALSLQFLSAFLSGTKGSCRTAPIWLQQKGASDPFCGVYSDMRRNRGTLYALRRRV